MGWLVIDLPTRSLTLDLGPKVATHRFMMLRTQDAWNAWRTLPVDVRTRLERGGWSRATFGQHFGDAYRKDAETLPIEAVVERRQLARRGRRS